MRTLLALAAFALLLSTGCTPENVVSEQERALQDSVDAEVAGTLFEADLTQRASYKVHKNGVVVIKFAESVKRAAYTRVVEKLRANEHVPAVQAEQAGKEVCPLQ